jgi:S1-C subfamily serine protease
MNDNADERVTRRFEPLTARTLVMNAAGPQSYYPPPPPPPGYHAAKPRRRSRLALIVVVIVATLLAGVSLGYAFWGSDGAQTTDSGLALEPQTNGSADLPAGSNDTSPYGGTYDGQTDGSGGSSGLGAAGSADVGAVTDAVTPGLVDVNVTLAYGGGQGAGTGIVLSSSGYVLTNNHVIEGAGEISVTSVATGETYTASVLGYDRTRDIALLQLNDASGLTTVEIGDSSTVTVGDAIVVIGNAGGDGGEPTAAGGTVTGLDRDIVAQGRGGAEELNGLIEVAANVQAGQSGGPTVNAEGEVIGITTAASSGYSFEMTGGQGYAIPINDAVAIAEQILDGSSSGTVHVGKTAFLGVQVASASGPSGYGGYDGGYDSSAASGALVAGVLADTPAEQAGLRSGDVITAVDGRSVASASELTSLLGGYEPGDRVEIRWVDQYREEQTATVTLIEGPAA